ncbi:MAG: hypothetical protein AAFO95_01475, partial [Cyanobacteria bacterium J06600_6]
MFTNKNPLKLSNIFTLDLRSLALFRIALALVIIGDLVTKFSQIKANYSDYGNLPRIDLVNSIIDTASWSLHLSTGSVFGQQLLFLFALFWAGLLLIGYRTTLASVFCWLMLISLHNRNPNIVNNFDDILRLASFWSMFLPLGVFYSCDRALNTSMKTIPNRITSAGTVSFIVQLCLIYLSALSPLPNSSLWLVLFCSLLIFISWFDNLWRLVAIAFFIVFHFAQGLSLATAVLTIIWLALIPSRIWNLLYKRIYSQAIAGLKINYDRDCGFCKKIVYLLRTFLILPGIPLLEAQDNPVVYEDMEKHNSWVIEDYRGQRYFKWYGIAYVVSISPLLWWLVPILRLPP